MNNHINRTIDPTDLRWQAIYFGLNQLNDGQLTRIIFHHHAGKKMCCDTYNYDAERELWCPLAIGLDVPRLAESERPSMRDNAWGKAFIAEIGETSCRGFTLNPVAGVPGAFFRTNRQADVVETCKLLLLERSPMRIAA